MAEVAPTLRERPTPFTDPYAPEKPTYMDLYHPANGLPFLTLPAYDLLSRSTLKFGIHHRTAVTACCILAFNKPGCLSTSRDGDSGRVVYDLDAIIPSGKYFYHLDNPESNPLYPICHDFATWDFPHSTFPSSWQPAESPLPSYVSLNWTTHSQRIKDRDEACLVSGWKDSLTTAHVVGETYEEWVRSICGSS